MELSNKDRKALFVQHMQGKQRTRGNLMEAFFRASADAWKDYRRSGRESVHVGYSPIIGVDADKIVADLPGAHVLHVVRNPWSAYADTKKRAVPLPLPHYIMGWCLNQQAALMYAAMHPGRVHMLRFEDIIVNPVSVLGGFLGKLGLSASETLAHPSWNGRKLDQVYPWGTIRTPTPEANRATAEELSSQEQEQVRLRTQPLLGVLGYEDFLTRVRRAA
jgi:hypothetical protein